MKKMKRSIAIILSLFMCLALLAACGGNEDTPPVTPPSENSSSNNQQEAPPPENVQFAEEISIILDNNNIGVLNPFSPAANNAPTNWAFMLIHDRLLVPEGEGQFGAALAINHETEDYQTYILTLRQGVYFHNGEPFTAHDVVWTVQAAREGLGSAAHDQWRPVATATALDDHTVELVLDAVNVDFLFQLTLPMAGIVNERAMTEDPENGTWIGTGAYIVTEFATNDYVRLTRNDNYWDTLPITERLVLRFVPEMGTRTIMMRNGEAHVSFGTSAEDVAGFQNDSANFTVHPLVFNNPQGISFNMNDPITGDWNFRMAVMSAINREEISIVAAGDWATPVTDGTLWGYATEFRNNDIPIVPFDLDAAREYLAASSYNGEEVEIAAAIITNIRASEMLQQQLAEIGINTRIEQMDSPGLAAYFTYANNQSQMTFFSSNMSMSASSVRHIYAPGGAQNRGSFNDPVITEMLNEASSITDINTRRNHYLRIQELIAENPPIVNVFWRVNAIVASSNVGGMILPSDHHSIDLRNIYMIVD